MTVSRRQALVAGAAALPAAALAAQQPQAQPRAGTQPAAGMSEDPFLAACLLLGGKRQIEVCRFAQPKLQDAEVKQFSQAEIDEHETMKAELAKLGYQPPAPGGAVGGVIPAGGTDATGGAAAGGQPGQPAQGRMGGAAVTVGKAAFGPELSRAVMVDAEVHDTCINNTKQALAKCEQKGKGHFDKAFVGDQLHTHMGLKDKVQTFQKHASQEMQPGLQKALGIIEQHIATCEKLMEKCERQVMAEMKTTRQ